MPSPNNGVPKVNKAVPRSPSPHPKKILPLSPPLDRQEAFYIPKADEPKKDVEPNKHEEKGHDVQLHKHH